VPHRSVWISGAVQKALIEIDEFGAAAAAVTLMAMAGGAAAQPRTELFEMDCDKPFVFVLYTDCEENETQVLFTGIVNRP
jgi:serine protease inhibitor